MTQCDTHSQQLTLCDKCADDLRRVEAMLRFGSAIPELVMALRSAMAWIQVDDPQGHLDWGRCDEVARLWERR